MRSSIKFKELLDFTGEGFFDLSIEEQNRYKDVVYEICSSAINQIRNESNKDDVLTVLLISLQQVEHRFNEWEDYEMSFLIKETIEKIINEERNKEKV